MHFITNVLNEGIVFHLTTGLHQSENVIGMRRKRYYCMNPFLMKENGFI